MDFLMSDTTSSATIGSPFHLTRHVACRFWPHTLPRPQLDALTTSLHQVHVHHRLPPSRPSSSCTRSTGAPTPSSSALYAPAYTSHLTPLYLCLFSCSRLATPHHFPHRLLEASRALTLAMAREASASASAPAPAPDTPQPAGGGDTPRRRRQRSRSDPLLIVCRCFNVVTAAIAALCVAVNVLSAVHSFRAGADIFGGIFRCYAVVISLFVGVVETEWGFIMKFCKILEYWPARGMLQIFVAVMTKAYPNVERGDLILLQDIASYLLLACGLIYIISGILCLGVLKHSRQQKATSREQAVRDLEELEKRREELEALLIAERSETV